MKTKVCIDCNQEQSVSEFRVQRQTRDGRSNQCRLCLNKHQREKRQREGNIITRRYEKSPKGFLMREYRNMQSRVSGVQKQKAHLYLGKELLSRDEFYTWAMFHADFVILYAKWVRSNYDRKLTPTVDRIDSDQGYVLSNMEWVTHSENSRRGAVSPKRLVHAR